ncbi:MAG: stage III sporulation protein AF [Eubacteriales bacterium]|nr:stage III sporulation protein AF [Eubacteriales bacterium]
MTSAISSCAVTLVCTLTACAVLKVIAPTERTIKIASLVLGLFLLVNMTSPLISAFEEVKNNSFSADDTILNDAQSQISNAVLKETGDYINAYAGKLLDSLEIPYKNIKTVVENNDESGITIRSVCIYLDKEQEIHDKKIKDAITQSLCAEPMLIYSEE